ncbi:MAG: PD-(D/E)XK nuclease family protein [Verrucomicrobia bacterium]|nr:PD-(D/E)XK nuclease family protein [Verrucomicrobiota bacterium]
MIAVLEPSARAPEKPPPKDRIEELQLTVSASRLGLWHSCRLKFYFRYIKQIKKSPTPSMHAGSSVHAVLQQWNMSRWRREPFVTERFKTLFQVQWKALQADSKIRWDGEEEADRSSSWRALEHHFTETPIKADERPEAVEVSASADLSKHGLPTLIGVIDLVRSGGRIVDFKLAGKTPDVEQVVHTHGTQLTAYSLLYRDATGHPEGGLELHHLVRTKKPKAIITSLPPATEQQVTRLFRSIESYQEGVARQDFVPSPGFGCLSCEFIRECQRWQP